MLRILLLLVIPLAGCDLVEPAEPTQSDTVVVPYQFNIEYAIEQEEGEDHIARARLYDIAQMYDWTGGAGTIELSEGDSVFADDVELDIRTDTTFLTTIRVDYSETIPAGKDEYVFEMRRPDDERIVSTIPVLDSFEVDEIGELEWLDRFTNITWSPVLDGATFKVTIRPLDDDCLTVIGGEEGGVANGIDDTGTYRFDHDGYHRPGHDCSYELTFERRFVQTVPGRWYVQDQDLPANGVYAVGLNTVRTTFVAKQRD